MYKPDFKDFHRFQVPEVTNVVSQSESKPFSSIGTDDTGNMKELSLVCYQCVGKARRDVTNHGMCSAQSSSNYIVFRTQDSKLGWSPLCRWTQYALKRFGQRSGGDARTFNINNHCPRPIVSTISSTPKAIVGNVSKFYPWVFLSGPLWFTISLLLSIKCLKMIAVLKSTSRD